MRKRIVICADGTWNRPEKDVSNDFPSNVLRLARAISPLAADGIPQQVFYDWGVGSYGDSLIGGATGRGVSKNIMDGYRYIVQNYEPGDEIFLFGFSRGAYTVRSLCGLIYNCGILKRTEASLIEAAFAHYKNPRKAYSPKGEKSLAFRQEHAQPSRQVAFVGVWDTVGALGIPFSFLGLLNKKDEFYDRKLGPNVEIARHALAIDEQRSDFEPTVWQPRAGLDLKQVWFAGTHCDIGGSYLPDKNTGALLSDIPLGWMLEEANLAGLSTEPHLAARLNGRADATLHNSRRHIYRSKRPFHRPIDHGKGPVLIHETVKQRWEADSKYRPRKLREYVESNGWPDLVHCT
jgi:uncharacterized protein (DUF2235 family)